MSLSAGGTDSTKVNVKTFGGIVGLLEEKGPTLPFPHSSGLVSSKHARMRELRIQHEGRPYRVLYAFDPRRTAVLLIGGDKTGNDRWYDENVPLADQLYDQHLQDLEREASQRQSERKQEEERTRSRQESVKEGRMAKKFSDLVNRTMSPESQERARRKTEKMLGELPLDELRAALSLTQEAVAETLGVKQSSVSKILHGQDMYLSTLDKILRAMGGELEVYVALPDGKVRLSLDQFRNVAKEAEHRALEKRSHRAAVAVSV